MSQSRRQFIKATGAAAASAWHLPTWAKDAVWSPPPVRKLKVIEHLLIPLPDGTRLAARLFLPEDAEQDPVGAILEYIPYRKRTGHRYLDDQTASWLVPRGFAYVRVDIRGTGESDGLISDEYALPEQNDIPDLLAWLAEQPWCNGRVGMRGISYGAISAIQAAAKGAPELKAIVATAGTDNGYLDDVHTLNGCTINENVIWGTIWKRIMIDVPDPLLVGGQWKSMWMQRLEAQQPLVAEWMGHQLIDQYWQDRILTDFSKITCGVYAVGGLVDSYINSVPRLLERLSCPLKGLIGPWGHTFPGRADPGPGLDWAVEETRWWDYWLNDNDNGIMQEPMFRAFIADNSIAETYPADTGGRWIAEERWPTARVSARNHFLAGDGSLQSSAPDGGVVNVASDPTVGGCIPVLSPVDMSSQAAMEQSPDDARSTLFESAPLEQDVDIVGRPLLHLHFKADKPVAKVAARLNEVTADGKSWLVTWGALNLSHSDDHTSFEPLREGQPSTGTMEMYFTTRRIRKGSRLRLSVSQSQWPIVWPAPEAVEIQLLLGATQLELPVRAPREKEPTLSVEQIRKEDGEGRRVAGPGESIVQYDESGDARRGSLSAVIPLEASPIEEIDMQAGSGFGIRAEILDKDVNSYVIEFNASGEARREGWHVETRVATTMTSTPEHFVIDETLEAWHNQERVFQRQWTNRVKRNGN